MKHRFDQLARAELCIGLYCLERMSETGRPCCSHCLENFAKCLPGDFGPDDTELAGPMDDAENIVNLGLLSKPDDIVGLCRFCDIVFGVRESLRWRQYAEVKSVSGITPCPCVYVDPTIEWMLVAVEEIKQYLNERGGDKMYEQSIELDCPPGHPRPGDLIDDVIKGTGLPKRATVSRFFGNWKWDYSDIDEDAWKKAQPTLKERITLLYNAGVIRYGSW